MNASFITATMLYDLVACPHRVTMDLFGDPMQRDEASAFVRLLWERGSVYESQVIAGLKVPLLDLSELEPTEREQRTAEAMQRAEPLIYGGRIRFNNLLGDPDLLRREAAGYVAGDIKSGSAEEGSDSESKPKRHYAVQLGLYTDILERKGQSAGRHAFIWDIHGEEVLYDFSTPHGARGSRTLWQVYEDALHEAEAIVARSEETLPAYSATCKLCHWYSACVRRLKHTDDLTTIPDLGRSKRDVMYSQIRTVKTFADADVETFLAGKKSVFPGIGLDSLRKFHERAKLLATKDARPFARAPIAFPQIAREVFFDIEVDPMRDLCYLHGFVERINRDNSTEKFIAAFADEATPDGERRAFVQALQYLRDSRPCIIYYYSKYERTIYRKLQQKYPEVCSAEEIEELFDPATAIDLYNDVIKKMTEWPTWDYSIKTLAKYLGFSWRDNSPSGAASIEWFDRWVETGDLVIRQRLLDYNEDDCRATRVVRDGVQELEVANGSAG
jgi:predicted RecB family nuclease